MMMGCKKCSKVTGVLFLVFGVLFLLRDLGVWDFWNVQWWTVLFLLAGLCGLAMCHCSDCCAVMDMKTPKRR